MVLFQGGCYVLMYCVDDIATFDFLKCFCSPIKADAKIHAGCQVLFTNQGTVRHKVNTEEKIVNDRRAAA